MWFLAGCLFPTAFSEVLACEAKAMRSPAACARGARTAPADGSAGVSPDGRTTRAKEPWARACAAITCGNARLARLSIAIVAERVDRAERLDIR